MQHRYFSGAAEVMPSAACACACMQVVHRPAKELLHLLPRRVCQLSNALRRRALAAAKRAATAAALAEEPATAVAAIATAVAAVAAAGTGACHQIGGCRVRLGAAAPAVLDGRESC